MAKGRDPTFAECLAMMRKRDPQSAEDGFHFLRPRAKDHVAELIKAFDEEQ